MDLFVRTVRSVSLFCGYLAAALIGIAVIIVCQMVFVRYALSQNTIWQTDFVTYSLVAATFIGSPFVLMTRGHVNVDVLPMHVGPKTRFWLALFATLMAMTFCVVMVILTGQYWHEAWSKGWLSNTMWRVRLWIPYSSMPIGLCILTLQYVVELLCLVTGREPPFGIKQEAS